MKLRTASELSEDFNFDDAPATLDSIEGDEGPHWVWVLVESERAPEGLYVKRADSTNFLQLDQSSQNLARRSTSHKGVSSPALSGLLDQTRTVAAARRQLLRAIARGFQANDLDSVVRYARELVGG